ncbi:hypothetical protein CAEBREN_20780 [Caenorhabditis brenneri]|uniref:Uncharacterized protein n=1 Tax=Caenorhabditis brenneri TaxID=135651 RepID=G0P4L1_CAEBE|nr:hypothetical protein CAEBREN_20780 [Caenorhabditis brenneri]
MDPAQAEHLMETLGGIKAKILGWTTQDQAQSKEEDHVGHQETLTATKNDRAHAQKVLYLNDQAEHLIRKLQETNEKQGKMIASLQKIFWEIQAQSSSKKSSQFQETPILSPQLSRSPVIEAEDQNDLDAELQETPILTPPTPVSRGAASRIIILSHPSETPSDLSIQAQNTLDRISKLLSPTSTLARGKDELGSSALEPAAQETPIPKSKDQNHLSSDPETLGILQAKIASLEDAIHSKSRQISEMEQDHEETVRLMSEQLENAHSRFSPKSMSSTEARDLHLECLEDKNIELNKLILQNIEKAEMMQITQENHIKELEDEVETLRVKNMEMIRLEKELTEREVRHMEINEQVAKYKEWIKGHVLTYLIEETAGLKYKVASYENAVKTLKDELKDVIQRKRCIQTPLRLEESEIKSEMTDKKEV